MEIYIDFLLVEKDWKFSLSLCTWKTLPLHPLETTLFYLFSLRGTFELWLLIRVWTAMLGRTPGGTIAAVACVCALLLWTPNTIRGYNFILM